MQLVITQLYLRLGKRRVLQNIDLSIPAGEIHALLGPTGCGKSLLAECIAGIRTFDSGEIFLHDEPLRRRSALQQLGVVFECPNFFSHLTMQRNLALALSDKESGEDTIHRVCERLRVSHLLGALPDDLTNWQSLQMQLARALLNSPHVLVLDTPFEQIPSGYHNTLRLLLADEANRGTSVLITTRLPRQAQLLASKIAVVDQGAVVQYTEPKNFFTQPRSLFVAHVFFDQGFGVMPGTITKRLKKAFDCIICGDNSVRIPCKIEKLLDFSGEYFLLGAHTNRIHFTEPNEPSFCVSAQHMLSKEPGDCFISLWRLRDNTVLETRSNTPYKGPQHTQLWVCIRDLILFDEYGAWVTCL